MIAYVRPRACVSLLYICTHVLYCLVCARAALIAMQVAVTFDQPKGDFGILFTLANLDLQVGKEALAG